MKLVLDIVRYLLAALVLPILPLQAQTFNLLHTFVPAGSSEPPGYYPMVVAGNTLYGVTSQENTNGLGGIFRINTDGSGFTNIFKFSYNPDNPVKSLTTISDGGNPQGLILVGNTLYGTTSSGGTNGSGTVYSIHTDGTDFNILHYFNGRDGYSLQGTVVLYGSMLYGTAFKSNRFPGGYGTIYAVGTNGGDFTNLFYFSYTNGANPMGTLVVSAGKIYGTTTGGGSNGSFGNSTNGTIFCLNTDGSGFTNYHHFSSLFYGTNYDGANTQSGLLLVGDTLYGQTEHGGPYGTGTIFAINTNGGNFRTVLNFGVINHWGGNAGLAFANGRLYGTTALGGKGVSSGNVYSIEPDGTNFNDLYDFPALAYPGNMNSIGGQPVAAVVISGNSLYGITSTGGTNGAGAIYSLTLRALIPSAIPLDAQLMNGNLILGWTNSSFVLQSSPDVTGPYTNVAGATSPYTNTFSASQQFFRLQY